MFSFLHSYLPDPIFLSVGPLSLRWYGLIMAISIAIAIVLTTILAKKKGIPKEDIIDAAFWAIIGGIIGARLYEIFLEWPYYIANPERMIRLWEGGLAIHGGIIGGGLALLIFFWNRRKKLWRMESLFLPGLALGQALGRWGNYFNQELFGRPTSLPWGIPIALENRPEAFTAFTYFHPTFLYESLGNLIIAIVLWKYVSKRHFQPVWAIAIYVLSYSVLRFSLEFIKIDRTPIWLGLRWPQIMSLIMAASGLLLLSLYHANQKNQP